VEVLIDVGVKDISAVDDVEGTRDHKSGKGGLCAYGSPIIDPDNHRFTAHDPAHGFFDVIKGFRSGQFQGQDAHILILIHYIKGLVDHAALVFRKIEVASVILHGELEFLPELKGHIPSILHIFRG